MGVFIYNDADGILEITADKKIKLKLKSERRIRFIGSLARNPEGCVSYYKVDTEKEIFIKKDAWSINYNVLNFLPDPGSTVNIKTEKAIYRISKEKCLATGSFLHFKDTGVEKKIYIPLNFFNITKL